MTEPMRHTTPTPAVQGHHRGHSWMMIACCIPMLVIAAAIALSGAGIGFLFVAIGCTAMMALMMSGMHHDDRSHQDHTDHDQPHPDHTTSPDSRPR